MTSDPRDAAIAPPIAHVRRLAEAALLVRLNAGAGFADPRIASQIFLRDPDALARVAGGTLRPQGSHRKAAAELAREVAAQLPLGPRLGLLAERMELAPDAIALVAVALAYAVDLDARELAHALAPRRRAALYLETCAEILATPPTAALRALAPGSPLRRARLIAGDGDDLGAAIELAPMALAWLTGDDALIPPLALHCELVAIAVDPGVALPAIAWPAADHIRTVAIALRGPRGSGRRAAAHHLARAIGKPLLVARVPALLAAEKKTGGNLIAGALAAARMRGAVAYLADADALYDERGTIAPEHADALASSTGALIVGSTRSGSGHLELGRPQLVVAMPRAELADRERAWRHALAEAPAIVASADELAARYVIGPGAIAEIVGEAKRQATALAAAGAPAVVDLATVEAAVGRRLTIRLGTFGTVVARKARFDELILPDEVVDTLRDMIAMVRERAQILERWGYQRHLGISRGVSGLFSGEPGTGKTMAASVIASALGLELVRIDLSAVVSKYVGDTEKNLGKIFDEAQDAHALLLFDEADSLFGKRTELKSAQDRFANLEVNYILQRMETFDGVSVLTTNAESAIDPALQRRLNFRIRFPEPEIEEREILWQRLLPPATELALAEVDFRALAEKFDMTGGYIKNAIVRAAVIAARAGRGLTADDLWAGAHHEYVEMGKVMPTLARPR